MVNQLRKILLIFLIIFLIFNDSLVVSANPLQTLYQVQSNKEVPTNIYSPNRPRALKNKPPVSSKFVTEFCGGETSIVHLYEDINARGEGISYRGCDKVWYEADLRTVCRGVTCIYDWSDEASSVYFKQGYNVPITLWEHINYGGACIVLKGRQDGSRRTANLTDFGWNDRASSLAIGDFSGSPYNCSQRIILD